MTLFGKDQGDVSYVFIHFVAVRPHFTSLRSITTPCKVIELLSLIHVISPLILPVHCYGVYNSQLLIMFALCQHFDSSSIGIGQVLRTSWDSYV
jgi:hypothetical protein